MKTIITLVILITLLGINSIFSQFSGTRPDLRLCGSAPNYYTDYFNCKSNNYTLDNVFLSATDINGVPLDNTTCIPGVSQTMYITLNYTSNSNSDIYHARLFADLTLQSSPKNSFFYRVLKSTIGFYISSIFRHSFSTPNANQNYIGIIKMDRYIFFELNSHNIPVNVWRKSSNQIWAKEQFIGFQL